jgi:hypothetical protein
VPAAVALSCGAISISSPGKYRLVPSGDPDAAAFLAMFREDKPVLAGEHQQAVKEVLQRFRAVPITIETRALPRAPDGAS